VFSPRWQETRANWFLVDIDDVSRAPQMKAAIDAKIAGDA
jgi:hypothetical protein